MGKPPKFNINERDIGEIIRAVRADYGDSAVRICLLLYSLGVGRGNVSSVDIVAELKRGVSSDVMGDGESRGKRREVGDDGSMSDGRESERNIREAGESIKSSDGQVVLGYVKDGDIYLHESVIDADTPIHKYKNPVIQPRSLYEVDRTQKLQHIEKIPRHHRQAERRKHEKV